MSVRLSLDSRARRAALERFADPHQRHHIAAPPRPHRIGKDHAAPPSRSAPRASTVSAPVAISVAAQSCSSSLWSECPCSVAFAVAETVRPVVQLRHARQHQRPRPAGEEQRWRRDVSRSGMLMDARSINAIDLHIVNLAFRIRKFGLKTPRRCRKEKPARRPNRPSRCAPACRRMAARAHESAPAASQGRERVQPRTGEGGESARGVAALRSRRQTRL